MTPQMLDSIRRLAHSEDWILPRKARENKGSGWYTGLLGQKHHFWDQFGKVTTRRDWRQLLVELTREPPAKTRFLTAVQQLLLQYYVLGYGWRSSPFQRRQH